MNFFELYPTKKEISEHNSKISYFSAPTEIRTLVLALKGLRPGPLDDGGDADQMRADFTIPPEVGQGSFRNYRHLTAWFFPDTLGAHLRIVA